MFVLIRDRQQVHRFLLDPSGETVYGGIVIYHRNNDYYVTLKENYYFHDRSKTRKLQIGSYEIVTENSYYALTILVYPNDEGIDEFHLYVNRDLIIAASEKADVVCRDPYLKDRYLILKDAILQSNYEILLNGRKYDGRRLRPKDIVQYLGITIIYYEEFLYINSFCCSVRLPEYEVRKQKIAYAPQRYRPHYHLPLKVHELHYDELKRFDYNRPRRQDILRVLLPNIVMSLAIGSIATINFYSSLYHNQEPISRIAYLIMPVGMLITGVLLPLVFHLADLHKEKKAYRQVVEDYLEYLAEYEKKQEAKIVFYQKELGSSFFDLGDHRERMFYADPKSPAYLQISLGKRSLDLPWSYDETKDPLIDARMKQIASRLTCISDVPVFLSLKEHRIVTVASKGSLKRYYFRKFLLEITYKHHYDDLYVAIYAQDPLVFDEVYHLPHLFFQQKRLTLNSYKQIRELDQCHFDRDLVLFVYDELHYAFSNPRIHVLYFSEDKQLRYKNSDAVVEYDTNKAFLYEEEITGFTDIEQDIAFQEGFHDLGRFSKPSHHEREMTLSDIFHEFDIEQSYRQKHQDLRADFAYGDHEVLSLDLHEAKQGPHGLIGGATGSGKSELIVSLLLSLCIRYSPDYLNIILIDYKGGGIKESLSSGNRTVPHITASISNLENHVLERLIIALHNECQKRERLFKELSQKAHLSVMNIGDYLNSDYQEYGLAKIAHLLIVVDEFAQLKKEHPEQIKELISLSRIGRSLGIHLILATQRPSGNIDEEIWSNSRFKISLKVFEERDSQDIVKVKQAAYLQEPGEFLLRVDESLIRGRSVYSKSDFSGNDPIRIAVADNMLGKEDSLVIYPQKTVTEAAYYVSRINETCERLGLCPKELVFLPPEPGSREDRSMSGKIILGRKDDYYHGIYEPLAYEVSENLLICDLEQQMWNGVINQLEERKRRCVIISNREYQNTCISDLLSYEDKEDILYLFRYVLSDDPEISLLIEDLNVFLSYDDDYSELLLKEIRRSEKMRHNIIAFSSSAQISFRLLNVFKKKILAGTDDRNEASSFFGRKIRYQGRNYYLDEEAVTFVPFAKERLLRIERQMEAIIRHIPEHITSEGPDGRYLAGYDLVSRKKVWIDEDVCIVSYQQDLLDLYHKAYPRLKVRKYDRTVVHLSSRILWLGPGIFNQRLFLPDLRNDLRAKEGLLLDGEKQVLLRRIDEP